ncbi:MAG: VacJ family lipoprotein [Rhodospirillaceae bacterium]|jgi:phospholipid-binding lipoprotein MlaA|nr:VacJ family lipoprotein [Rhodospirillaceae bacterium]MBT6136922.1 VacJ family lipoprotein [Rhodospirillaceae bacterium]
MIDKRMAFSTVQAIALAVVLTVQAPGDTLAQSASGNQTSASDTAKPSPLDTNWDKEEESRSDPLEFLNRPISAINRFFRQGVLDPVVKAYKFVTPDAAEMALSAAASNLTEPFSIVGALIGGDLEGAGTATARFVVNTSIGVGGLADVATAAGLNYCREDIGQGLAQQGVGTGPHVVAPIIGPSNLRDLPGKLIEVIVNPLPPGVTLAQAGVEYSGKQEKVEKLTESSIDPYVTEREAYEQNRLYEVKIKCELPRPSEATAQGKD